MRVAQLASSEGVAFLDPVGDKVPLRKLRGTKGQPFQLATLPSMRFHQGAFGKDRPAEMVCSTAGSDYPLFSERTARELRETGMPNEQWIPVEVLDYKTNYELYNCIDVIGALLPEESELSYSKRTGHLSEIKKHVFDPSAIGDRWFFRDSFRPAALYCTDRFIDHVLAVGLEGFWFRPVWDSEHPKFSAWPSKTDVRTRPEIWGPEGIAADYGAEWWAENDG